jgi:hypothetical protein
MSKYIVKLKSGLSAEFEAEDDKTLHQKLASGNYGILPVRGSIREVITSNNVAEIIKIEDQGIKK